MKTFSALDVVLWLLVPLPFAVLWWWEPIGHAAGSFAPALGVTLLFGAPLTFVRLRRRSEALIPLTSVLCVGIALLSGSTAPLGIFPSALSALVAWVFLRSLARGRVPVVQIIAERSGEVMNETIVSYCRWVTIVWGGVLMFNTVVALAAWFDSPEAFVLYNGVISYALFGFVFATEYSVRMVVKNRMKRQEMP